MIVLEEKGVLSRKCKSTFSCFGLKFSTLISNSYRSGSLRSCLQTFLVTASCRKSQGTSIKVTKRKTIHKSETIVLMLFLHINTGPGVRGY